MEVKNLSWNSTTARSNHKLLPKNVRGLIVGKSDCGKTTLLLNLLLNPGWLDYNKLFVFSKSLFQPEYQVLRKAMEHKLPKEAILWLCDNQRDIQSKSELTVNEFKIQDSRFKIIYCHVKNIHNFFGGHLKIAGA